MFVYMLAQTCRKDSAAKMPHTTTSLSPTSRSTSIPSVMPTSVVAVSCKMSLKGLTQGLETQNCIQFTPSNHNRLPSKLTEVASGFLVLSYFGVHGIKGNYRRGFN